MRPLFSLHHAPTPRGAFLSDSVFSVTLNLCDYVINVCLPPTKLNIFQGKECVLSQYCFPGA